jgi:hypothetical protein
MENNNIIIDVEEYARSKKQIPVGIGNKYKIKVDHNYFVVDSRILTGGEILALSGKNANTHHLNVDYGSGKVQSVKGNQSIDLVQGVIKFMATPVQAVNGVGS